MSVDRLRMRLERVEALHRGATTDGERRAAAKARERLLERIVAERAKDPVARMVAEDLAALGVPSPRPPPPTPVPDDAALLRVLALWESGDWTRRKVHDWAARMVDAVMLPADPAHEAACRAEVLLQLAMLHRVALDTGDVPALRRFLRDRDWAAWFALLTAASRRKVRRPVRA